MYLDLVITTQRLKIICLCTVLTKSFSYIIKKKRKEKIVGVKASKFFLYIELPVGLGFNKVIYTEVL